MATRKKTGAKKAHRKTQEGRSKEGRFEREAYCWLNDVRTKKNTTALLMPLCPAKKSTRSLRLWIPTVADLKKAPTTNSWA